MDRKTTTDEYRKSVREQTPAYTTYEREVKRIEAFKEMRPREILKNGKLVYDKKTGEPQRAGVLPDFKATDTPMQRALKVWDAHDRAREYADACADSDILDTLLGKEKK
jgi:hypothetical protein